MIDPIVGIQKAKASNPTGLADALFTQTQARVLGILFGHPRRSFMGSEIIALARCGSGTVQRELARLESAGLVTARRIGRQKHFQANARCPVYRELRSVVLKTVGLLDPLRAALEPLTPKIVAAFVYGSVASQRETAQSDIDLLIVSDELTHGEVFQALESASRTLGRQVNPTIYTLADFKSRVHRHHAFLARVLQRPRLWLIGSDRDLAA